MRNLPIESTDMLAGPVLIEISGEQHHVIDLASVIEFDDDPKRAQLLVVFAAPNFGQEDTDGNVSWPDGPHSLVIDGESRILALAYLRYHLGRSRAWLTALAAQQA